MRSPLRGDTAQRATPLTYLTKNSGTLQSQIRSNIPKLPRSVELTLLGLWFVSGLGAVVFAAQAGVSRASVFTSAAVFVSATWLVARFAVPSGPIVAVITSVVAAWQLARSPRPLYAAAFSGMLGGVWIGVLDLQGVPLPIAIAFVALLIASSALLRTRRPQFAPPALRDEALLFITVLGVVAAAAPGVRDGWHAAGNLNIQASGATAGSPAAVPMWAAVLTTGALVSGAIFSLWSRR